MTRPEFMGFLGDAALAVVLVAAFGPGTKKHRTYAY